VLAHGDHQPGTAAAGRGPHQALDALKGRVWQKVVATDAEREALEKSLLVISTHLLGGLHEVRVYSESSPGDGFEATDADLEDVYFFNLTNAERN
jgi:ABC-2 type transport system ATP-binding protein